jgi:hypothetical protein
MRSLVINFGCLFLLIGGPLHAQTIPLSIGFHQVSSGELKELFDFLITDDLSKLEFIAEKPDMKPGTKKFEFIRFKVHKVIKGVTYYQRRIYSPKAHGSLALALNARHRLDIVTSARILKELTERNDPESFEVIRTIALMPTEELFKNFYPIQFQKNHIDDWAELFRRVQLIRLKVDLAAGPYNQKIQELRKNVSEPLRNLTDIFATHHESLRTSLSHALRLRSIFFRRPLFDEHHLRQAILGDPEKPLTDKSLTLVQSARQALNGLLKVDELSGNLFSNIPDENKRTAERAKIFVESALQNKSVAPPAELSERHLVAILSKTMPAESILMPLCQNNLRRIQANFSF